MRTNPLVSPPTGWTLERYLIHLKDLAEYMEQPGENGDSTDTENISVGWANKEHLEEDMSEISSFFCGSNKSQKSDVAFIEILEETISQTIKSFSSISFQESIETLDNIDQVHYSYIGTILKIQISSPRPTRIYFKGLPSKYFWWSGDKELPEFVQNGVRVEIIYKEIIAKTYAHLWIENFKTVDDETKDQNQSISRRKPASESKYDEAPPVIKCFKCKDLCYLIDFKQCEGIIKQSYFGAHCNHCLSKSDERKVGTRCIRESMLCRTCHSPRNM